MEGYKLRLHTIRREDNTIAIRDSDINAALLERPGSILIKNSEDIDPEAVQTYSREELLLPLRVIKNLEQPNGVGTYDLYVYPWKGHRIGTVGHADSIATMTIENIAEKPMTYAEAMAPEPVKQRPTYKIVTEVPVTTIELIEDVVTLAEFMAVAVRSRREELGLTQEEAAGRAVSTGIPLSGSSFSIIERGLANPQMDTLEAISFALDIHISELFPPKHG